MIIVNTVKKSCAFLHMPAFGLLWMTLLLIACSSDVEQERASSSMKFSAPGGAQLFRMIDANTIVATLTLLAGSGSGEALQTVSLMRVGQSGEWQSSPISVSPGVGYTAVIVWSVRDDDGNLINYARQTISFTATGGAQLVDLSTQLYQFDSFDQDNDGLSNFDELMDGTLSVANNGTVEVGNLPVVAEPIDTQLVQLDEQLELDLSDFFADPEGQPLTYTLISPLDNSIAIVRVNANTGELDAFFPAEGRYLIDVSANDSVNVPTTISFEVIVISNIVAENISTVSVTLDSVSTVPPANVDGASGEGSFSVDTETGAFSGSVTVSGTTGVPVAAHIHAGGPGVAGEILIPLEGSVDGTVWTAPDSAVLDAAAIAAFEAGELYVNVHTEANIAGELRGQLVQAEVPSSGSLTIRFTNTSATMPMTPPVVVLHNAPDVQNGIRLFEVGQPASAEIIEIAENGNNTPLVEVVNGQLGIGTVTAAGVAFTDPQIPSPLLPGETASITLDLVNEQQVLSTVSMIVCSNDGFSGIDSRPLSTVATEIFTAPIYDAGSETNVLALDYWVPPCGGIGNLGDEENGSITAHPGQFGSENADFDFAAGSELLEIAVTRN